MYALLLKVNFIRREEIFFPPEDTGRHANLDRQHLLVNLGMSPEAISLVERLPFSRMEGRLFNMCVFFKAMALSYLEQEDLEKCRDPHDMKNNSVVEAGDASSMSGSYLLPDDVALTLPYEGEGRTWILDLKYSTSMPRSFSTRHLTDLTTLFPE